MEHTWRQHKLSCDSICENCSLIRCDKQKKYWTSEKCGEVYNKKDEIPSCNEIIMKQILK